MTAKEISDVLLAVLIGGTNDAETLIRIKKACERLEGRIEEYAKQQAIGFATWCDDEVLTRGLNSWHCLGNPEMSNKTDDELYAFFINYPKEGASL